MFVQVSGEETRSDQVLRLFSCQFESKRRPGTEPDFRCGKRLKTKVGIVQA